MAEVYCDASATARGHPDALMSPTVAAHSDTSRAKASTHVKGTMVNP